MMSDPTIPQGAKKAVDAPAVHTDRGAVRGLTRKNGSSAYLGIPFAAPPVGDHRFAAPAAHSVWEGVLPATRYGATPQRSPLFPVTTIPEPSIPGLSTLNVNVFTPAPGDAQAKLPVFVWIHGGGYVAGSPASPWYDGRAFNRDGAITVTVSYRLGFDGFGWVEGTNAPLNRGLLDQIAALEWVQRNIAAFGGDPTRVTIGGQSAGGGSVQKLLVSPRAYGLFRGAISHSAATGGMNIAEAQKNAHDFAQLVGVNPDVEGWRSVSEERIAEQERELNSFEGFAGLSAEPDVSQMIETLRSGNSDSVPGLVWSPVIDGDIVPNDVKTAIVDGSASSRIPLLLGTTRNEFAFPAPPLTDQIAEGLRAADIAEEAVQSWLREIEIISDKYSLSQLRTSIDMRCDAPSIGAARVSAGAGERTWLFDFAGRSSHDNLSGHCLDLPFAWDLLDAQNVHTVLGQDPDQNLADEMHADWVRFITDGEAGWKPASDSALGARLYESQSVNDDKDPYRFEKALLGAI